MNKNKLQAISIGGSTLVGYLKDHYPIDGGNCFDVLASNKKRYQIVNFGLENLEEGIRRGKITFPIDIIVLGKGIAIIDDVRIPNSWYWTEYCSTCCPQRFLPDPQKRAIKRDEFYEQPITSEKEGVKFIHVKLPVSYPDWRTKDEIVEQEKNKEIKWVVREEIGITVLNPFAVAKIKTEKEK